MVQLYNPVGVGAALFSFVTAILGFAAAGVISTLYLETCGVDYCEYFIWTSNAAVSGVLGFVFLFHSSIHGMIAITENTSKPLIITAGIAAISALVLIIAAGALTGQSGWLYASPNVCPAYIALGCIALILGLVTIALVMRNGKHLNNSGNQAHDLEGKSSVWPAQQQVPHQSYAPSSQYVVPSAAQNYQHQEYTATAPSVGYNGAIYSASTQAPSQVTPHQQTSYPPVPQNTNSNNPLLTGTMRVG